MPALHGFHGVGGSSIHGPPLLGCALMAKTSARLHETANPMLHGTTVFGCLPSPLPGRRETVKFTGINWVERDGIEPPYHQAQNRDALPLSYLTE